MSQIARTAARLLGALALAAALAAPGQADPMQGQVIRDGVPLALPDGFVTMPYLSPRGRMLVEPSTLPEAPLNVMQMPFSRSGNGDPIIFSGITTAAKQFEISKPADANAYRFVNPCNVDVRIRKVGSLSESVTLTTGTRFMARSSEVLGTSNPRYVSVIAMATPTGDCSVELQYGRGS